MALPTRFKSPLIIIYISKKLSFKAVLPGGCCEDCHTTLAPGLCVMVHDRISTELESKHLEYFIAI